MFVGHTTDNTHIAYVLHVSVNTLPRYSMMHGYKFIEYEIDSYSDVTLAECSAHCDSSTNQDIGRMCYSFSYNPSTKQCSTNTNQHTNIITEDVRVKDSDWELYTFGKYTVPGYCGSWICYGPWICFEFNI